MQFDATIPNVVGSDARGEDAGAPPDSATADAPGPDSVEPAAVAKLPTVARAAGAPRELKQRPGVWVLAAAVLGLLAGGGAGVVANGRRSAGITEGQRLAHDGWWIDLAAARWIGGGPPGRRVLELDLVVFDTRVARGEQPRDAGRWFALLSDTGARFPAYWTRARGPRGARLRLVFPAAAVSPRATLRFAPPGSRPLLMRLVPR